MRLTNHCPNGMVMTEDAQQCSRSYIQFRDIVEKLAAYEDAEEQGRLVILPCKVGDALFVTDEGTVLPAVRIVESVTWWNGKISILAVNKRTGSAYRCLAEDFGKTVFLTREEAKAAMKERHYIIYPSKEENKDD